MIFSEKMPCLTIKSKSVFDLAVGMRSMRLIRVSRVTLSLLLSGLLFLLTVSTGHALDLNAVYQLALDNNPDLKRQEQLYLADQARIAQSRAALLPELGMQLRLGRSYKRTDTADQPFGSGPAGASDADTNPSIEPPQLGDFSFGGTASPRADDYDDHSLSLTLSAPIYDRQARAALKLTKSEAKEAFWEFEQKKQALQSDVVNSYLELLRANELNMIAEAELASSQELNDLSQARFDNRLGNKIDVLDSQTRTGQIAAEALEIENQKAQSQSELFALTNQSVDSAYVLESDTVSKLPLVYDLDYWVDQAIEANPVLQGAKQEAASAAHGVGVAKAARMPSLSFAGSYSETQNSFSAVSTDNDETQYSIALVLDIPLYQGGSISARHKEAGFRLTAAELKIEDERRQITKDLQIAYNDVKTQQSRLQILNVALEAAAEAQWLHQLSWKQGLESQLDTLTAERELFRVKKSVARAKYDFLLSLVRLKQASGLLNDTDINEFNALLVQPQSDS